MARRRREPEGPLAAADAYARGVLAGTIPAGRLVRLAVERDQRDLRKAKALGLRFDPLAGARAIEFFRFLTHSKGEWAGREFVLEPWQQWIVSRIFGWRRLSDGTRRFRTAYTEIPRKNGKSQLAAGVGVELLVADGEPGAEIYSAATKRDQARIVHGEAIRMVKRSPPLKSLVGVYKDNLNVEATGSKYEPLGADSDTMDGLNIHGAVIDELHAHRTRAVWDVIDTAMGSRRQPLVFAITTAGSDETSICWEVHERARGVLEGTIPDETLFAFIAAIDEGDDWRDPAVWAKANPNLGVSVKPTYLAEQCEKAKTSPGFQNAFLRLHLNRWTRANTRFLALEAWDACEGDVRALEIAEQRRGAVCFGGLDLSSKTDLTAFVLVFPPEDLSGGVFDVLAWFWMPADAVEERVRRDHVPYDRWIEDGWIEATPGNVIDYRSIRERVREIGERFRVREIAFDRWGALSIYPELEGDGFQMVEFGQGFKSMSPPTKELEKLVLGKQLRHGGNPVLRWMADCLEVKQDPAGNVKPVKPDTRRSAKRIDGMVALVMALSRSCLADAPEGPSVYEERGALIL